MASSTCIISKQNKFTSTTSREYSCNFNPNSFLTPTIKAIYLLAKISFMTSSCALKEHPLVIQSIITFLCSKSSWMLRHLSFPWYTSTVNSLTWVFVPVSFNSVPSSIGDIATTSPPFSFSSCYEATSLHFSVASCCIATQLSSIVVLITLPLFAVALVACFCMVCVVRYKHTKSACRIFLSLKVFGFFRI